MQVEPCVHAVVSYHHVRACSPIYVYMVVYNIGKICVCRCCAVTCRHCWNHHWRRAHREAEAELQTNHSHPDSADRHCYGRNLSPTYHMRTTQLRRRQYGLQHQVIMILNYLIKFTHITRWRNGSFCYTHLSVGALGRYRMVSEIQ